MASATAIRTSYLTLSRDRNIPKPESPKFQLPPRFVDSQNRNTQFRDVSLASSLQRIRLRHDSAELRLGLQHRVRVSSNDAQFGSFSEENEVQAPSLSPRSGSKLWRCLLWLWLCNADRIVMSVAIVPLSLSNGLSRSFAGIVQSSFLWGYLVSPIAGGTLVDYYAATFLTPWAVENSLWALLAMRALLGIAEGVALPCMNNMVARWFPQTERSRAVGLAMAGYQLGSAVGLMLSPILMSQGGIFGPFVIFGLSGFLWVKFLVKSIGFVGPGIALVGLITAKSPAVASAWLTSAVGLKSFSHSGFLVNLQEIAPQYSGVLHAGFFVELVGSFQGFLLLTSLLYILAALFYVVFSTGETLCFCLLHQDESLVG
ncbi:unnamed protein product [Malus baccata var. baccata]